MNFIILAIDHKWQMVHVRAENQAAKKNLETTLAHLIPKVSLICEESDPCYLSVAQKMAYEHVPHVPWKNITMSSQERLEAGIYDALLERPSHVVEDPLGSGYYQTIDHRIPEDDVREQFFASECVKTVEATGAKIALVLCGDMHVDALKQKLESGGHQTGANHDLITKRYWQQ